MLIRRKVCFLDVLSHFCLNWVISPGLNFLVIFYSLDAADWRQLHRLCLIF